MAPPRCSCGPWMAAPADGSQAPARVVSTPANEQGAVISPDGRWMLSTSDESGRNEIHVRSYPAAGVRKQLSTIGFGATSTSFLLDWAPSGRELLVSSTETARDA